MEQMLLRIINHDRRLAGVPALRSSRSLTQVALFHSLDMANHGYISHVTLAGASPYDRLARSSVRYSVAGENLGWDGGAAASAMLQAIEGAMLRSPEHRANLLRASFSHIGVGIAWRGSRMYVTEDFTG
jgi:uncharacterized protein YkwD